MKPVLIPELLAPAGNLEALRAAINNGADAVYFGLDDFNARHRATNFSLEALPETMQLLRAAGVRGYVTFNTLIFSGELERAATYLAAIAQAGVDAIIVQDLGLVRLIRELAPTLPIHGSTQMTLADAAGVEFVGRLGVQRVILARELSIREIAKIARQTTVPVEVFVHGALCVAYSGQCLTSEALGGRSANRGQCAQACRQPYDLLVDGVHRDLGELNYILSPKDLAAWSLVPELREAGVCSLKIEGRLKSPHYVAVTTQTYREALDAAIAGERLQLSESRQIDLAQSFSRGFSPGFLEGVDHQRLVEGFFPKHRGVLVGTVQQILGERVVVRRTTEGLAIELKPGDGVVFDQGHPEQDEQGGRLFEVETATDDAQVLLLAFGRGDLNLQAVEPGARVWRTDDPALRRRTERTFAPEVVVQRVPVDASIAGAPGQPLTIELRDEIGHIARVESPAPFREATRHPVTRELIEQQIGRLGGTPFLLRDVRLFRREPSGELVAVTEIPVMAPKSVLNQLRRDAVSALTQLRTEGLRPHVVVPTALTRLREEISHRFMAQRLTQRRIHEIPDPTPDTCGDPNARSVSTPSKTASLALNVLCRTLEQFRAIVALSAEKGLTGLQWIDCDFEDVRLYAQAVQQARAAGCSIGLATPRILKPSEQGLLRQLVNAAPDAILVRNVSALSGLKALGFTGRLRGDYSLNVTNEVTADLLLEEGLISLVPGYDLNLEQLLELVEACDPGCLEVVIHQHIPMFHMEHCVFSHVLSNGRDHHDCGRPCERHRLELRDHVGETHPIHADIGCRNTVFRDRPQSAVQYLPRLIAAGLRQFRVELLRQSGEESQTLIGQYARALAGREGGFRPTGELTVLNQVGLTRGTLEHE